MHLISSALLLSSLFLSSIIAKPTANEFILARAGEYRDDHDDFEEEKRQLYVQCKMLIRIRTSAFAHSERVLHNMTNRIITANDDAENWGFKKSFFASKA